MKRFLKIGAVVVGVLVLAFVGYSSFDSWEFKFHGDEITASEFSITGDYTYNGLRQKKDEHLETHK